MGGGYGRGTTRSEPSRATVKWPAQSIGCDRTVTMNEVTIWGERRRGRKRMTPGEPSRPCRKTAEILVEGDEHAAVASRHLQDDLVARAGLKLDHPFHIVSSVARGKNRFAGCVLVGEEFGHASECTR